jgi:hypothetical protein
VHDAKIGGEGQLIGNSTQPPSRPARGR